MPTSTATTRSEARIALERACEHLLALQDEAGWWPASADERDDGRRGHAPARVPGDPHRGRDGALGGVDPLAAA